MDQLSRKIGEWRRVRKQAVFCRSPLEVIVILIARFKHAGNSHLLRLDCRRSSHYALSANL
jgi:hypothetical protein